MVVCRACWHPRPEKRPTFNTLLPEWNHLIVDQAIRDTLGRKFWKEYFLERVTLTTSRHFHHCHQRHHHHLILMIVRYWTLKCDWSGRYFVVRVPCCVLKVHQRPRRGPLQRCKVCTVMVMVDGVVMVVCRFMIGKASTDIIKEERVTVEDFGNLLEW